jgi:predicted Zn-dependent protease
MRSCLWLLVALPLLGQDRPGANGANSYSLEKEAALGAQLASDVARTTQPLESPGANEYVSQLGQRLASKFPEAMFSYTFAVIADDRASATHEPLSLPGGYVFVPAGLFLAARSEAEFAGMMAHAMAHVAAHRSRRHAAPSEVAPSEVRNTGSAPLIYVGGWAGYAGNQGHSMAIPTGLLNSQRLSELEADRLAVHAMAEAGFEPAALASYISRVQPPEDAAHPQAFSSLPARDQRVAALREAIQKLPARIYTTNEGFQAAQDEVRQTMPALPPAFTLLHTPTLRH